MSRLPFGIGDFVASFKGDTPGHPFRGNQFEGGSGGSSGSDDSSESGGDLSFEDVHGDPSAWKPDSAARHGASMLKSMGFSGTDIQEHSSGTVTVITDKAGFSKVSKTFDRVALDTFNSSKGTRYHAFIPASSKKNKAIIGKWLKDEYDKSSAS